MTTPFLADAEALAAELTAIRRDLHMHPELGFQEFRTAGFVAEQLNALGYEVVTGVGKTGVVGLLPGGNQVTVRFCCASIWTPYPLKKPMTFPIARRRQA